MKTKTKSRSPMSKRKSQQKQIKDGKLTVQGKRYTVYRPHDDPAFFNIFVEKKHADHLARKDLDDESRL
jgi:hypothetical protein